jgi:hypothetical protein
MAVVYKRVSRVCPVNGGAMRLRLRHITEVWCEGYDVDGHEHEGCTTFEFEFDVLDLPEKYQQYNPYEVDMVCVDRTARDRPDWPKDGPIAEMLMLYINTLLAPHIDRGELTPATVESVTHELRLDRAIYKNEAGTEFLMPYRPRPALLKRQLPKLSKLSKQP